MRESAPLCAKRPVEVVRRPFYSVGMAPLVELRTRDPERALPTLEEYFPGVRMSNPHGNFTLDLVAADVETMSMVKYRLRAPDSSSSADLSDGYTLGHVNVGTLGMTTEREQIDTTRPWLFPEQRVHANWDDVTITALTISKEMTLRMARAQVGSDAAVLTFTNTSPLDESRARQWAAFVEYTRGALTAESSPLSSPLVRTSAFAHLVGLLLETFPNSIAESMQQQSRPLAVPGSVRRATEFIDANAHLPITLEDVARASRLSIRALQYAFRRTLDTTPTAYLRRARLAGAHRDLRNADPTAGATVLDISLTWGFGHPGRFAQQYREAYGVAPRRTLET
jgi:AraC-like DNA-binding protein